MLSLYCILFTLSTAFSTYPLIEQCKNASLQSVVGHFEISNTLLPDALLLQFDFRDGQLCEQNETFSVSVQRIVLKNDTTTFQYTRTNDTFFIQLNQSGLCDYLFNFTLVVDAIINTSLVKRNIALVAYPAYQLNNCLVTRDNLLQRDTYLSSSKIHSPLYWYAQFLTNESMIKENEITLCNEPLYTVLYRSDLYLDYCDPSRNQTARTAWYQMAIQVITIAYNAVRKEYKWLWLHAVEILERNCDARYAQLSPQSLKTNSLFNTILQRLNEANRMNVALTGDENQTQLCATIRAHFELTYNETMSKMLYNQWYYKGFSLLLMPGENMKIYAILLIVFFCIIPFALLAVLGNAIYRMKKIKKE